MPMLSYKAGRAIRRSEDSNWVDPVAEKGTLAFEVVDDLAQLIWTSREAGSNTEREEYLLFPEDVQVEAVSSDPTGRTYVFKFSSSDQRLFLFPHPSTSQYWFQDIDSAKYPEFANKINGFLADPDSHSAGTVADEPAPQPAIAAAAAASLSTESSQPPLSTQAGIPQTPAPNPHAKPSTSASTATSTAPPGAPKANRVEQLMGSKGGREAEGTPSSGRGQATSAIATSSGATAQEHQFSQEQLGALAALLGGGQGGNAAAGGYAGLQEDILTASTITPLLRSDPALINRLIPLLPKDLPLSSPPTASEIQELLTTPQWTEAVAAFDAALRTGELQGVMPSLGLGERAGNGVREFLEEVGKEPKGKEEGKEDEMDTE
ncbi:hypothetical protein QFC21_003169 [Naganishia friedmannii]|uniref:Uncharacterized protein n=1 Tax=Naganishia friedmannii TaxID=89922 RepID=A0ACC2VQY9_9TREE|nr:hypothetical protein QFC21_003169 [Naganishia friedmannii]